MMPKHALNHGTTNYSVEPALSEIRDMLYAGDLTIAPHNYELIDELRNYHRDDGFKIVKQRDDLMSAMRYAVMMRRAARRDSIATAFLVRGSSSLLHSKAAPTAASASPSAHPLIPAATRILLRADEAGLRAYPAECSPRLLGL